MTTTLSRPKEKIKILLLEGIPDTAVTALAAPAVDVFPVEPTANDDRFVSPLPGLDNVILSPPIGGSPTS